MTTNNGVSFAAPSPDHPVSYLGSNAPRGVRTVLTRTVKEGANVPLFLGQTLINALRDLGYNDTTSAICEHVDNAFQWGATEVRVYFHEVGKPRASDKRIDVLVYDNGAGMAPNVLKTVTAFGGSMCFDNRESIGRFGMGMKAAALSISPVLDIYSWQEGGGIYSMTLDVDEIANDQKNLIHLPDPELCDGLPLEVRDILTSPMTYPKNADETQRLLANDETLTDSLGASGTIIHMPGADRLTYRQTKSLVDHATKHMARIYRRQLARGLRLYINNRRVEALDPTYFMENARHASVLASLASEGVTVTEVRSRLVNSFDIEVPEMEGGTATQKVVARLYLLPIEQWHELTRKTLKNIHVFEPGVSFMRSDREVQYAPMASLTGKTSRDPWWRLEIEFPASLDEAFGVAVNKQGVRPKHYVIEKIDVKIREEIAAVRRRIEKFQSERSTAANKGKLTAAEERANEADALQANVLPQPVARTDEEARELEARLRELAIAYKRPEESDEEAVERIRKSKFVTTFRHDEGPFFGAEYQLGRVILAINTGHAFFQHIYEPIAKLGKLSEGNGEASGTSLDPELVTECTHLAMNMQLMLLALARTQSEMVSADPESRRQFDRLRKRWSDTLDTMLIGG